MDTAMLSGVAQGSRGPRGKNGFSLLELMVVTVLVALMAVIALDRLWGAQVDAERAAMETVVGALQSAIGIKVAEHIAAGDMAGLAALDGGNPMDRLLETPKNYLGALRNVRAADIAGGQWYFDAGAQVLVYRVANAEYFRGGNGTPARARFALRLEYESPRGARRGPQIVGARLVAVEPYAWMTKLP